MRYWFFIGLGLALGLGGMGARLQAAPAPVIRAWDAEQGLPTNNVTAIAQTPDGYLWVGTDGGVARFDGVRFTSFGPQQGLPATAIRSLLADREGRLWIATTAGKYFWLRHGVVTPLSVPEQIPAQMSNLWLGVDGQVYASTRGGVVNLSDRTKGTAPYPPEFAASAVPPILPARDGAFYARVSGQGLWAKHAGNWARVAEPPGVELKVINVLAEDAAGALWVAQGSERVWRLDAQGWVSFPVVRPRATYAQGLAVTPDGTVWLALAGSGLWRLENGTFVPVSLVDDGLDKSVEVLFVDRDGQLWAGTNQDGLLRVSEARVETCRIEPAGGAGMVRALLETEPGTYVVGTLQNGTYQWKDGQAEPFATEPEMAGYIFGDALLRARDGSIWLGTGNGLHQFRGRQRITDEAFAAQFKRDSVRALCEDDEGTLWVGTQNGRVCRVREGRVETVRGAGGGFIWALAKTRDGAIWAAMRGRGVQRITAEGVKAFGLGEGLPSEVVVALHVDARGTLWVGTEDGGLACWRGDRFAALGHEQGLADDNVAQILDDGAGRLWLAGKRGLQGVAFSELEAVLAGRERAVHPLMLGRGDGMLSAQCWPMVAIKDSAGRLCFGTARGFVRFFPPAPEPARAAPRTAIEEVIVDGQGKSLAALQGTLALPPGTQRLEVRYTGLDLNRAEQIHFRYRLAGLEKEWNEIGTQRVASYSLPPPGRYRFEVEASVQPHEWNAEPAVLAVTVNPYFWQTGWFGAGVVCAGLVGVALTARFVERRRLAQKLAALERQRAVEAERARIARDLHDDLGGSLTEMAMLSELAQASMADPARAREHLDRIFTSAQSSTRALDEIVWAADPGHDRLDAFVAYLSEFAQSFTAAVGLRCRLDLAAELPEVPLSAPVRHHLFLAAKEALHNVAKHAEAKSVRLRVEVAAGVLGISVADDGRGTEVPAEPGTGADGLGNMRRRMSDVGGTFALESVAGKGTVVVLSVPVERLGE